MITSDIIRELRDGDTVALVDSKWLSGTRVVGTVKTVSGRGIALDTHGVGSFSPRLSTYEGTPRSDRSDRTLELVQIGTRDLAPVEAAPDRGEAAQPSLNRRKLVELATWLGGEHAKKQVGLPSEWNQGSWMGRMTDTRGADYVTASNPDGMVGVIPDNVPDNWCGTTACAAGHVALVSGGRFSVYNPATGSYEGADLVTEDVVSSGEWDADYVIAPDGERIGVAAYAQQQLGLDAEQAQRLFAGENSYDRMMELLAEFIKLATPRKITAPVGADREERLRAAIAKAAVPEVPEFTSSQQYEQGDRVQIDGKVYEARISGPCRGSAETVKQDSSTSEASDGTCWRDLGPVDGLAVGRLTGGVFTASSSF